MHRPTLQWSKHATHGRAKETEEIKKIIKEIEEGAPSRIVGITGPSGIGKSVLVTEGIYPTASETGFISSGKFDQFLPQTPYAAVLKCLRSLFHSFFFDPSLSSSLRSSHILSLVDLVGPNKEILCGAIPELSPLLPSPPSQRLEKIASPHNNNNNNNNNTNSNNNDNNDSNNNKKFGSLSPTQIPDSVSISETRNRFHSIFLGIVAMIAENSMITIFVDDVQWADTASLELLASLIEGQRKHLLIIVASREQSLPPPLSCLPLTTLFPLLPFTPQLVLEFVRGVLSISDDSSMSLATALHARTSGNPFFVSQLLRQAISDGIVSFDSRTMEWVIDVPRISHMSIVSDVVEFLLNNLKKLPASVSEVLRVAACLGSTFCVDTLELVLAKFNGDMHGLYLAEAEGLVVREPISIIGAIVFRFSHDRVMQASHTKNTDLQIQQIHLAAGEVLMQQGRDLYEIADHYAKALPLVPVDQLLSLCALFLKVAKNAKIAAAFDSASRYAQVGIEILKKSHPDWASVWKDSYALIYPLLFINMECAFNHGDLTLSSECYKDIQQHATLDGAMLALSARMILLINESQFSESIDLGCEGIARLGLVGITLPRHPTQMELGAVFSEIDRMLQGGPISNIFQSLPPLTNQLVSLAVTILMSTSTASYFYDISVFAYSSSLIVQLTLQYGLTPQATPGLAIYGLLCSAITGDVKRAYEIGEAATILSNIHGMPVYQCQVHFLFYSVIHFYQKHVRENLSFLRRGLTLCAQVGNTLFGAFNAVHVPMTRLWKGDALEEVAAECIFTLDSLGAQCRFADALPMTSGVLYCCRSLMGVACKKDLDASRVHVSNFGTAWAATLRVKAHNLLHKYDEVLADVTAHCQNVFEDIKGQMHICMLYFHYSLTLASLFYRVNPNPNVVPQNSLHYVEKIKENLVVLRNWAAKSQINCEHRCILIEAEMAHIANKNEEALQLFETASRIATQREFHQHNAIILERMTIFFLRIGQVDRARNTLKQSIDAYARWGACTVISVLVTEYADLLGVKTVVPLDPTHYISIGTDIDVAAVLDCSSVVTESSNLGKLLTSFLSRVVTHFHAAYGCILLTKEDACYAHVRWSRFQNVAAPCASLLRPPVLVHETFRDLSSMTCCARAVRCAVTMKRTVVVSDIPASGIFSDAYFTPPLNSHARSLVCMPLLLHSKVLGIVYLESDDPHSFTIGNLQTLQLMCAQAAIAVENSHLVENEVIARAEAEAAIAEKDVILKEMQASQQRYQTLAQAIPQLIWICKSDGYVEWANDQYTSYLGSSIVGNLWSEYVHPDDLPRTRSAWLAASLPGATFCEEFRLRDKNGDYQWFLSRALPAHDSKGNVARWFGTNTNVDAQKKNLEERARLVKVEVSERYYRALAEALPQLVWTSLADGRVNYYNVKWREFSGVTLIEGEVMGWWPLVHPGDIEVCKKHFERSVRKCKGFEVECRLKRHDGQFRWHLVRALRLKDPIEGSSAPSPSLQSITVDDYEDNPSEATPGRGYYYFGTCTDIDDQKKAEVSLIDARKAAERMAEMKSQWVANMSHELRTPSNGILGMLDLLMDTPLTPEQKDYVATMRRSTNVLLTVISDILDFRRNETRQVKLQVEPFTVHGVMEDVCEILFPLAAAKNVELVHVVQPDVPRVLLGDPARLRQILVNLIGNSIKFSNESGGHVEVSCRLTTPEFNESTSVSLSNSNNTNNTPTCSAGSSRSSSPSPSASSSASPSVSPRASPPLSPRFSSLRLRQSSDVPPPPDYSNNNLPSYFVPITSTINTNNNNNNVSSPRLPSTPASPPSAPSTPIINPTPSPAQQNVWLRFDVSDSGVGIPKEQQAMLFEPFFQVDSSATRKHGGTGLGLAISRQIVGALGGRIWVQSEEGSGSTFSFTAQFPIPSQPTLRQTSTNSRFAVPHPISTSGGLSPSINPQRVIVFSDRKGATMRVLIDNLSQMIPSPSPSSFSTSPISVVSSASELVPFISQVLSHPAPPSSSPPYIACVLELSDVPSTNYMLSILSPFISRRDYIFRVVMITSPHLRAQITLPSPSAAPYSPSLSPMSPSVVFLMKPLSESKLRTSLSLSPVTSPIFTTVVQTIPASSPLLSPSALNPASPTIHPHPVPSSPPLPLRAISPLTLSHPTSPSLYLHPSSPPQHSPQNPLSPSLVFSSPRPSSPGRGQFLNTPYSPPLPSSSLSSSSLSSSSNSFSSISSSFSSTSTTSFSSASTLSVSSPLPVTTTARAAPPPLRLSALVADVVDRQYSESEGYSVASEKAWVFMDIANDGSEAVEKVAAHPIGYYQFLLMDLQMPVMDGFVATKLIREREATLSGSPAIVNPLPIIAITANVMPGVQQRCSEAGMDGYVSKPVQAAQLSQVLRELAIII